MADEFDEENRQTAATPTLWSSKSLLVEGVSENSSGPYLVRSSPDRPTPIAEIIEALRNVTLLTGLTTEEYAWLAVNGTEHFIGEASHIFREGQPAVHMTFMLKGEVEIRPQTKPRTLFVRRAGETVGLLPFSRMRVYGGDGTTTCPLWALNIHKDLFTQMFCAIPSMGERCIGALLDRVRQDTRVEQQAAKSNFRLSDADNSFRALSTDLLVEGDIVAGRFRIVRSLGGGGMGLVYHAHDTELEIPVALKIIRPEFASNPEMLARFRREVLTARRITHRNVCRTFDFDHERRQVGQNPSNSVEIVFLTMEYLEGETLKRLLTRRGRLEPDAAQPIANQMAAALTASHQAGIVHRDLKPANVIVVSSNSTDVASDRVVVTDFGLACFDDVSDRDDDVTAMTVPGRVMGTLAYMAPEQLTGGTASPVTDIYSFGLVLYEMVTGEKAFPNSGSLIAAARRLTEPPPSPRTLVPDLPTEWDSAVLGCLQIDPRSRLRNANDVIGLLGGHAVS